MPPPRGRPWARTIPSTCAKSRPMRSTTRSTRSWPRVPSGCSWPEATAPSRRPRTPCCRRMSSSEFSLAEPSTIWRGTSASRPYRPTRSSRRVGRRFRAGCARRRTARRGTDHDRWGNREGGSNAGVLARARCARRGVSDMSALRSRLAAIVGDDRILTRIGELRSYEADGLPGYQKRPSLAVFPGTRDETVAVVRVLADTGTPYVARGAGTGLSGGALADDVVLLGLHRLKRIISIDRDNARAVVEPGVVNSRLTAETRRFGLHYAPG